MKKLILMFLMAGCFLMTANAQKTVVSQTNQKVFDTVEQMPEYPGGMQAMPKWTPGKEKGKVVRVQYNLPIVFRM